MYKKFKKNFIITCFGLFSSTALAQIQIYVNTDTTDYYFGESITLQVSAYNTSEDSATTLTFPTSCQTGYYLGEYYTQDYIDCVQIPSQVTIPPHSYQLWYYYHTYNDHPIQNGTHTIVGEVLGYGLSDTVFITVTPLDIPIDTTEHLKYFPLHVGDRWQYRHGGSNYDHPVYSTREVIGDTIMPNGEQYYTIEYTRQTGTYFRYLRVDTTSLEVWRYLEGYCENDEYTNQCNK